MQESKEDDDKPNNSLNLTEGNESHQQRQQQRD